MNKKLLRYGASIAIILAVSAGLFYSYAYATMKQRAEKQGEVAGFKLFLDGMVIDQFKINPSVVLAQVYLHGTPWQLLWQRPDYIAIKHGDINADTLLNDPVKWPFALQSIEIASLKFTKTILGQKISFTGFAKQTPDTPILVDFNSDNEKLVIAGKAELRIENHQLQMIDINFDQIDIDHEPVTTKRGTGWLSFSYEDNWQIVGEIDAGITLLSTHEFFDSSLKLTGPIANPEITFAGLLEQQSVVIDKREDNYFLRQDDQALPITTEADPLPAIITALDQAEQIRLARVEAERIEQEQKEIKKQKKAIKITPVETIKPVVPEAPPPVAFKIEPIALPEILLANVTANTSLAGFIYLQGLVQVMQPCTNNSGQCWTAHGQSGQFSYNPNILPAYFLQLKDYEQVKQLKSALLNFNVQSITVQGKDKTAQNIVLKGTTAQNQPAEIQLSVLE